MTKLAHDAHEALIRTPGKSPVAEFRDYFERVRDSLEEMKKANTVGLMADAAVAAAACNCKATECSKACPLDKPIPKINEALQAVDFEYLITAFGDVMAEIDAHIAECQDMPVDEYFIKARRGFINRLHDIIDSKEEHPLHSGTSKLRIELDKLKRAVDIQLSTSPFAEFTGKLCSPSPCEGGTTVDPTGCTLAYSGKREPTRIRKVEYDLASLALAFGWLDKKFQLPASWEELDTTFVIAGAGYASLEAAYNLRLKGHKVVIYDTQDEIGGLIYRGIPDHKMEKDRLIKYRLLLQEMGVEFRLSTPLTKELYNKEAEKSGHDLTFLIGAFGTQDKPVEPDWVPGYDKIKNLPNCDATINYLRPRSEEIKKGNQYVDIPQRIGIMGSGFTAIDGLQSTPREMGHLLAQGLPGHYVLGSDRSLAVGHEDQIGAKWGQGGRNAHGASTSSEDIEKSGGFTLYGATPIKFDTNEKGEILVTYQFDKPNTGVESVAKDLARKLKIGEPDPHSGAIYQGDKVVGVRLRDKDNRLIDYPLVENARWDSEFRNTPLPLGQHLEGTVGPLTMTYDRFYYALNCHGAGTHPLAQEFGMGYDPKTEVLDVKNNRSNVPHVYLTGDIALPRHKQILPECGQDGKKTAAVAHEDALEALRAKEEKRAPRDWAESRKIEAVLEKPKSYESSITSSRVQFVNTVMSFA